MTNKRIGKAISKQIAEQYPGYIAESWVVVVSARKPDKPESTNYRLLAPEGQGIHTDEGLLNVGLRVCGDLWSEGVDT